MEELRAKRVGFCPSRLVLADRTLPLDREPIEALKELVPRSRKVVILSNHFARYVVLSWSAALRSESDWLSYARHTFAETYGLSAAAWTIRVSAAAKRAPRVACAIDTALLESVLSVPGVCSVRPYLMSAFNAHRHALAGCATSRPSRQRVLKAMFVVAAGDTIEATYRVDSISDSAIHLTYLPLGSKEVLAIPPVR